MSASLAEAELNNYMKIKGSYDEIIAVLRNMEIFRTLNDGMLESLSYIAQRHSYRENVIVVEEDSSSLDFYCIASGSLMVTKKALSALGKAGEGDIYLNTLRSGDIFGESAIFDCADTYIANVITLTDTVVVRFPKDDFIQFLIDHNKSGYRILSFIIKRLLVKLNDLNKELAKMYKDSR
ncbi:cAMP-binding protein [Candidatus Magnetoovum chiemensis]|nr:cAMP-binding protein [Candidatus Magnetoovum chiemensis]